MSPGLPAADDPDEPVRGRAGTLVLLSDVACPWATVLVLRLREARAALGPASRPLLLHLAHPLELVHRRALSRRVIDAEIPACAAATPEFGWSLWQGRLDEYPVSSLPAIEAVQAARRQSEAAAETLDLALRRALFVESRCITLRHEILDVAANCPGLDATRLAQDLDAGVARRGVLRQAAAARAVAGPCTGTLVQPDGAVWCNPGIEVGWLGPPAPRGAPVVHEDAPDRLRALVATVAATAQRSVGAAG